MKDTHVTSKCVWPKQSKPVMPFVGMTTNGLRFYTSQLAKSSNPRNPKSGFQGLVKIIEGVVSKTDLEKDFGFHFP
jgi:hypothetical protein